MIEYPHGAELWVFAYGSLMWDPGFDYEEAAPARLHGYHRAFCIHSLIYRGTRAKPGLVFGLDHGGSCRGLACRVRAGRARHVLDYLAEREIAYDVYLPRLCPVRLKDRRVRAVTLIANRANHQYAGKLAPERVAEVIVTSRGKRGHNLVYLENTVRHLDELGIHDKTLSRILRLARARRDTDERRA